MDSSLLPPFEALARQQMPAIELALAECLQPVDGCPLSLTEAMRYSLLAPGKRLRPLLVLMAAEACGGEREAALPAACAVEMIHTYSLIHDDLPAMDDDDLRRGRPTNHKVFGEALAILAGDALLTLAFEVLAKRMQPPAVAARCCATLATAAGATALVGGQVDDIAMERLLEQNGTTGNGHGHAVGLAESLPTDPAERLRILEAIHRRKTGAMFLVSLRLGALSASADETQLAALDDYGKNLGLAFQIMDDLLDVHGTEAAMGKRVGKDADRGKLTFPGLLGIEESRRRAAQLTADACAALSPFGAHAAGLDALARFVLERDR